MAQWKYFEEAEFIYNGEQDDPQLKYNGQLFNYYDIEDSVYNDFKEHAKEFDLDVDDDYEFEKFCKDNQELIREYFKGGENL